MSSHIILVGAGQGAASCIAALRGGGFGGEITLIGAEPHLPYQRPPLSKAYLLGDMALERLFLRPAEWYAEQNVRLILGQRATKLCAEPRQVEIEGGTRLDFDHLVLATGASPHRISAEAGGDLDGIYYMRDLADADALEPAIRPGGQLLVIGGGYIGLEAAAVARQRGMEVRLIHSRARILSRVACAETSAFMRDIHTGHGVEIIENTRAEQLLGEGRVRGARLNDGREIVCDTVVVGIGVAPEVGLAESAGLALDNGIAVDEQGRAAPGIWAIGDCASFPHAGGRLRLESVGNAIDMGELVARNILGAGENYAPKPWFWSDQYDVKLQMAGLGDGHDRIVIRAGEGRSHWYYRGGALIAVDAMNDARAYMVGKRLIEAGKSPAPEAVADPGADLKALLRG